MILPTRPTAKSLRWNTLSAGTTRFSTGATTSTATSAANTPNQLFSDRKRVGATGIAVIGRTALMVRVGRGSGFGAAALHREDALRALLDEDDDEDQHHDLGEHRTGPAFEELVQHAQAQRGVHRARQLAHAAKQPHEEAVEDV